MGAPQAPPPVPLPGYPRPSHTRQLPICAVALPTGWYLFQFHRVLQYAQPRPGSRQPFFWMFVDNLVLTSDDRLVASRFLEVRAGGFSGGTAG